MTVSVSLSAMFVCRDCVAVGYAELAKLCRTSTAFLFPAEDYVRALLSSGIATIKATIYEISSNTHQLGLHDHIPLYHFTI